MVFRYDDDDEDKDSVAGIRQSNPFIAELEKLQGEITVEVERLNHEYNKYFGGAEKSAPVKLRLALDKKAERLKIIMKNSINLGTSMRVQNAVNKYNTYIIMWDSRLKKLETTGKP